MDVQKVLSEAAAICGPSGQEMCMADYFAEAFRPYVDEVTVDKMFNVIAQKKGKGPKVMLCSSTLVTRMPVKAPTAMNPACPSESSPEIPTTRLRDTASDM